MQSVSSRIWTRVTVSFSYDINYYITGTSQFKWYQRLTLLVNVVEANPNPPFFSIATTPRCRRGRCSFPCISPVYYCSLPYNAECKARQHQVQFFESLVWLDLGLNPGLPDKWRTPCMFAKCRKESRPKQMNHNLICRISKQNIHKCQSFSMIYVHLQIFLQLFQTLPMFFCFYFIKGKKGIKNINLFFLISIYLKVTFLFDVQQDFLFLIFSLQNKNLERKVATTMPIILSGQISQYFKK